MVPPAKTVTPKPGPTGDVDPQIRKTSEIKETVHKLSLIINLLDSIREGPGKPNMIRFNSGCFD